MQLKWARNAYPTREKGQRMAYRILIVEDDPDAQQALAMLLGLDGHHVEVVTNGREALVELLAGRSYDVILSDLRMPEIDGEELFRRIEDGWPHLVPRVVFLSGQQTSVEFREQYSERRVPILKKPVSPDRLRQVMASVVGTR